MSLFEDFEKEEREHDILVAVSQIKNKYGKHAYDEEAYAYYLQADFAIRQRLRFDHYGDLSVADSIRQRLNSILGSGKIKKPKKSSVVNLYPLLYPYLKKYRKLQAKFKLLKNGDMKLSISIVPFRNEKYHPKLFITETGTGFCGMLETLNIKIKNTQVQPSAQATAAI